MRWLTQVGLSMTVGHWTVSLPVWGCLLIQFGVLVALVWKARP